MKRIGKVLVSFVCVITLGIAFLELPVYAENSASEEAASTEVEQDTVNLQEETVSPENIENYATNNLEGIVTGFDIKWIDPQNNKPTDNKEITMKADKNYEATKVRAELSFSVSQANIGTGEIEIRLPAKLFTNREEQKQGDYAIGTDYITSDISYSSTYDAENNEIVLTNNEEITDAHTLIVQIDYYDADIENGEYPGSIVNQSVHSLEACYEIAHDNNTVAGKTDPITVLHEIETILDGFYRDNPAAERVSWDPSWGEEPDNCLFIKYSMEARSPGMTGSMPYKLTLKNESNNNYNGQFVTWDARLNSYNSGGGVKYTNQTDENGTLIIESYEKGNRFDFWLYVDLVMAYPKEALGDSAYIRENVTLTLSPYYPEDGNDVQVKKLEIGYSYDTIDFEYPPGNYGISKGNGITSVHSDTETAVGVLDKIKILQENEFFTLPADEYWGQTFENDITVNAGYLTLKEGGNPDSLEDYEQREYTVEAVDDLMMFGEERLVQGDYSFPRVVIRAFSHYTITNDSIVDPNDPDFPYEEVKDYQEMEPIEVWYSTTLDDKNWKRIASVKLKSSYSYEVTYEDGKTENRGSQALIDLPENTVAVKATVKSKRAKVEFEMNVGVNLHGTEHLKGLVEKYPAISRLELFNVSTLLVKDSDGEWVNSHTPSSIKGSLADIVHQRDLELYGVYDEAFRGHHDSHTIYLSKINRDSNLYKSIGRDIKTNSEGRYYFVNCQLKMENFVYDEGEILSEEDFKKLDLVPEESRGKMYDLLPLGAFIDETTIKAGNVTEGFRFNEVEGAKVTIEYEHNWRESGRTMAIFNIELPEDFENFDFYIEDYPYEGNTYSSTMGLSFDLIYPFESVKDYGINIRNLAAYQSENTLFAGQPDNGECWSFEPEEIELFKDLDKDGIVGGTEPFANLYDSDDTQISDPIASQIEFSKSVKNNSDLGYKKSTQVLPNEQYSYRIRIGKAEALESKDIVLFDVLESAHGDNPHWKGTLESVDVTQLVQADIAPVIYYSTKDDIRISKDLAGQLTGDADLGNSAIWSTTMPEDKSTIKAVAVDMRKDKYGADYVLDNQTSLVVILNMKAPVTQIEEYMKNNSKAYNDAWLSNSVKLNNTNEYQGETGKCNPTEVTIRKGNLGIDKTSDPASGPQEDPTDVKSGDTITYDVAVENQEISNNIKNIIVEDTIPAGLTVKFDEIKYYYNDDKESAKLVSEQDDEISVERDAGNEQKLIFKIGTLNAKDWIHFLIPTTVDATEEAMRYENQAFITEVDGVEYGIESPITYHETPAPVEDFTFTKTDRLGNALAGAKFGIYEKTCTNDSHSHDKELVEVDGEGNLTSPTDCFKLHGEAVSENGTGVVIFSKLHTGKEYRLVEYDAPGDYLTPEGQWIITYNKTISRFEVTDFVGKPPAFKKDKDGGYSVMNYKVDELPITGGRGRRIFMLIGTPIMLAAGYWLYRRRKRVQKRM